MSLVEKLKKNWKKAALTGTLAASSLFYSGCETAEDSAWFGALAGANAGLASTPRQAAAWGALSQGAQTSAIIQGQKEAAREGRSEINVYPYSAIQPDYSTSQKEALPLLYYPREGSNDWPKEGLNNVEVAVGTWNNMNSDSVMQRHEFKETSEFNENEVIAIVVRNPRDSGVFHLMSFVLRNQDEGYVVDQDKIIINNGRDESDGICWRTYSAKSLGEGRYSLSFSHYENTGKILFDIKSRKTLRGEEI